MDQNAKQQVVEKLKGATNVLITVNSSPNIDQLAAAIGLALMLGKLGKHATAVYSGQTPSAIEFLSPEENIRKNTDSLQDFIISLDKSKADKLRYKVEDDVVKVFITPYRNSISSDDLNFSQGDVNVDAIVALGVEEREHLDQAILAHGRILHDATVMTVMAGSQTSNIGSVNWQDQNASSLSEMLVSISEAFQSGLLDNQMSTAFLTGIVSETERFRNEKTTPKVMTMAAQLMAAGANQSLIADNLLKVDEPEVEEVPEEPEEEPAPLPDPEPVVDVELEPEVHPDELKISNNGDDKANNNPDALTFSLHDLENTDVTYGEGGADNAESEDEAGTDRIHIDDKGKLMAQEDVVKAAEPAVEPSPAPEQPSIEPAPAEEPAPEEPEQIIEPSPPEEPEPAVIEGADTEVASGDDQQPSTDEVFSEKGATEGGDSFVMGKKHKVIEPLDELNKTPKKSFLETVADEEAATIPPANAEPEKTLVDLETAVGRQMPQPAPADHVDVPLPDVPETNMPALPDEDAARNLVAHAEAAADPFKPQAKESINAMPLPEAPGGPPPLPPPPVLPGNDGPTLPAPQQ